MQPQGWYRDPYRKHDDRWFSDGQPTTLVRDQGRESYDEPPQDRPPQDRMLPSPCGRPAGQQVPPAREGRAGQSWTVWLPGMLTLAAWGVFFWWAPFVVIVAVPVIALLAVGVKIPEWRLAIVEPEARAMLLDFDRTTTHRSVVAEARS